MALMKKKLNYLITEQVTMPLKLSQIKLLTPEGSWP